MKQLLVSSVLSFALLAGIGACSAEKQKDPAREPAVKDVGEAVPDIAQPVFENEFVRVTEFTLKPGDDVPLHEGMKRAAYSLTDYRLEWTEGSETTAVDWSAGDAHWHEAIEHAAKNIGDTEARYITVSRKSSTLPEPLESEGPSLDEVSPETSKVVFENEDVQILDVRIDAGAEQPSHAGRHRLVYSLSDYTLEFACEDESYEKSFSKGDGHWHPASSHCAKNVGESKAHYLVFAFKR